MFIEIQRIEIALITSAQVMELLNTSLFQYGQLKFGVLRKLQRLAKFAVQSSLAHRLLKVNNMDMKDDNDMSDADSEFVFDMDDDN